MDLATLKLLSAAAILAVAVVGGIIPMLVAHRNAGQRFFSLGNAFAGGLFLGVGFVHLLPEGIAQLHEVVDYPLGALLGALGLVLLLLIDRVLIGSRRPATGANGRSRTVYPFVLLALLSIHSAIAGVALGLENHAIDLTVIVVGILCHKGSEAFALMVSSHKAGVETRRQKTMLAMFALMTPGGVLLGMLLGAVLGRSEATNAFIVGGFNALAAGTFIYVAIVDIIGTEFATRGDRAVRYVASAVAGDDDVPMPTDQDDAMLKFALIVVGIVLMAVIGATHSHHGH